MLQSFLERNCFESTHFAFVFFISQLETNAIITIEVTICALEKKNIHHTLPQLWLGLLDR